MQKKCFLAVFLLFSYLFAITGFPGEGKLHREVNRSDTEVKYHTDTDNVHWTGADRWAVYYNFDNYFSNIASLAFTPKKVKVFLPVAGNGIRISLLGNNQAAFAQPAEVLWQSQQDVGNSGWNSFEVGPISTELHKLWVVVDYTATLANGYTLAGSNGNGTHSYYYNGTNYTNFEADNCHSELMVTLEGEFSYPYTDVALAEFHLNKDGNTYRPYLKAVNNGNSALTNAYYSIKVKSANSAENTPDYYFSIEKSIPGPFNPGQENAFILEDTPDLFFTLRDSIQYLVSAKVFLQPDSLDAHGNDSKDLLISNFSTPQSYRVGEFFLRSQDELSQSIWQHESPDTTYINLHYFPNAADYAYYSEVAFNRLNFYKLKGYPYTVTQGTAVIPGYPDNYQDQYTDGMTAANFGFIRLEEQSATIDTLGNYTLNMLLKNDHTKMFEAFRNNLTVKAFVVQSITDEETGFSGNIAISEIPQLGTLNFTNNQISNVSFTFNAVDQPYLKNPGNDFIGCQVVLLVQSKKSSLQLGGDKATLITPTIYYAAKLPFSSFIQAENTPLANVELNTFYYETSEAGANITRLLPYAEISNNSAFDVDGLTLEVTLDAADIPAFAGYTQQFELPTLGAGLKYTINKPEEGSLDLPSVSGQYYASAKLVSSSTEFELSTQSPVTQFITNYLHPRPKILTENFFDSFKGMMYTVLTAQVAVADSNNIRIDYFYNENDFDYYQPEAFTRKTNYAIADSMLAVVVNGSNIFTALTANSMQNYQQTLTETERLKTFYALEITSALRQEDTYNLEMALSMPEAYLFSWYRENLTFNCALVYDGADKLGLNKDDSEWVFLSFLPVSGFQSGVDQTSVHIDFDLINYPFLLNNPQLRETARLVFWVQKDGTVQNLGELGMLNVPGDIPLCGYYKLSSFSSARIDAPSADALRFLAGPNPFGKEEGYRVRVLNGSKGEKTVLSVYDIKGRKVAKIEGENPVWKGYNQHGKQVAKGIYFVKMENSGKKQVKKVLFIK